MKLTGTNKKGLIRTAKAIMLSVCILCMSSCLNEELDGNRFMIQPVFTQQQSVTVSTKALEGTYNTYDPESGELVYAYAYNYAKTGVNPFTSKWVYGSFRKATNNWTSSLEVEAGSSYRLFAFNPGGASNSSGTISIVNGEYQLAVSPMKIITSGDPSISIASARSYENHRNPELTNGQFDLGEISSNTERDKVCLAMNHLYAKATPKFKMDDTYVYHQLRTIVITSVKAITGMGTSSMTVNFAANPNLQWGGRTNDSIKINLLNEGDSIILNTSAFQAANSFCYMPVKNLPVSLEVTYNVYQGTEELTAQNSAARLIKTRRNIVAKNSNILPSGENFTPKAGTNYIINITVMPTYLYQLTDDDLQMELTVQQTP
jgi:hypothetical protein